MIYLRSQISLKHECTLFYEYLYNSILTIIWVFINTYEYIFGIRTIKFILLGYTYHYMSNSH